MITVVMTCENGHSQALRTDKPLEWAQSWAGLMDGTSPMFVFPPGPKSVIGKCGICGSQLSSNVVEEP